MASGAGFSFDTLTPGIKAFPDKFWSAVDGVMKYHEPQVANYMKDNATWTDRTSNARNGLAAKAYRDGTLHGIVAFHQVPYGIWLEVAHDGTYKIIQPAILSQGALVMRTIGDVMARIKK